MSDSVTLEVIRQNRIRALLATPRMNSVKFA
jgi:hypothetical protein